MPSDNVPPHIQQDFIRLIDSFSGDKNYVEQKLNLADKNRSGSIDVHEAVIALEQAMGNSRSGLSSTQISEVLKAYARDARNANIISIDLFIEEIERVIKENYLKVGRFMGAPGFSAGGSAALTKEEMQLEGILKDLEQQIKYRNKHITLEDVLKNVEREERKLPMASRDLNGRILSTAFRTKITELGYKEQSRTDVNVIVNHYQGKDYKNNMYIDYEALLADMKKPKGAPFAKVFPAADDSKDLSDVKIDMSLIRRFLTELQDTFDRQRRDPKGEFENVERQNMPHDQGEQKLVGCLLEENFFKFIKYTMNINLDDHLKLQLAAKYSGRTFQTKGLIDYREICKDLADQKGGQGTDWKKLPDLHALLQKIARTIKQKGIKLRNSFASEERREGGRSVTRFTGHLTEDSFWRVLKQENIAVDAKEKGLLMARYQLDAALSTRYTAGKDGKKMDYEKLLNDLDDVLVAKPTEGKLSDGVVLTKDQQSCLKNLSDYL